MSQETEANLTCALVQEQLTAEPTTSASREVLEHLVDCDDCRRLRNGLLDAARVAQNSGADYIHPKDFTLRLGEQLDELFAAGLQRSDSTVASERSSRAPAAKDPPATPATKASTAKALSFAERVDKKAKSIGGNVVPLFRGRERFWVLGLVAAVLLTLWWRPAQNSVSDAASSVAVGGPTRAVRQPWAGKVAAVAVLRENAALELCDADGENCRAASEGQEFTGPVTVKTSDATRARLVLADGSEVVLGRSTTFRLHSADGRRASLDAGQAVLDVHADESDAAFVELPHGRVAVIGTKFALRAEPEQSWISVMRGRVRVTDREDRRVLLEPGQGTRIGAGRAPAVRHLASLADSFGWSERGFVPETADQGEPDVAPRGLGQLTARKPGENDERRGAVTLTRQNVKVRVSGAMARTEIEQEFLNHTGEVLEGIYRFPLPPGAQIERLALEVDGRWEEGAFVDRERAAAIWRGAIVNSSKKKPPVVDDIVWVPGPWKDPALLEWQRGGSFELRIFPIPERGSRRIILTYTEWLESEGEARRYTYPLPHDKAGSVTVGDFSMDVHVQGHTGKVNATGVAFTPVLDGLDDVFDGADKERLAFHQTDFSPAGDVVVQFGAPAEELTTWAYRDDKDGQSYVALALRPELPLQSAHQGRSYVIVVDRSRSMYGEHYHRATSLASRIVAELDPEFQVGVLACDSTCDAESPMLDAAGAAAANRVRTFLEGQTPEGASDLVHAVSRASDWLRRSGKGELHVVYIGDGSPTAGAIQPALIERQLSRALDRVHVSAVTVGSSSDDAALTAATEQSGGILLRFAPGRTAYEVAGDVLGATSGQVLEQAHLELPSAFESVAPARLGTLSAGREAVVVARMRGSEARGLVTLRGNLAGKPYERQFDLSVSADSRRGNSFVPRLFAAKRIAELQRDPSVGAKRAAIDLSEQFNVASRYTSLLVLASPAMFEAFGLTNQRHTPIWTGESSSVSESSATSSVGSAGRSSTWSDDAAGAEVPYTYANRARRIPSPTFKPKKRPAPSAESAVGASDDDEAPEAKAFPKDEEAPTRSAPVELLDQRRLERRCDCPPADILCAMRCEPPAPRPPPMTRRQMVPMRRVWQSKAKIVAHVESAASASSLSVKRDALAREPESRKALAELYAAYMAAADLERAAELAERWSEKDPLDPDALTARADVAAERGDRTLAIRILGSVVDVRPDEHQAQWRLARLFRWAGQTERSCAHYVAVAQLVVDDAEALGDALRCADEIGDVGLAEDLLAGAEPGIRRQAGKERQRAPVNDLRGEFRAVATWGNSSQDLDVVFIHPEGYRVSWLGAPTRAVITAQDVRSGHRDALALRGVRPGRYGVEVVRGEPGAGPVSGNLEIHFRGERRSFPFVLEGDRIRVADVIVTTEQVLVPL